MGVAVAPRCGVGTKPSAAVCEALISVDLSPLQARCHPYESWLYRFDPRLFSQFCKNGYIQKRGGRLHVLPLISTSTHKWLCHLQVDSCTSERASWKNLIPVGSCEFVCYVLLAYTSISFSTSCEKLVGTCMILWAGEASDFRIRRLNGMDILGNGTSMSLCR